MKPALNVTFGGVASLKRTLQLADVSLKSDAPVVFRGLIRKTMVPGLNIEVVNDDATLEGSTRRAFASGGVNIYGGPWVGYGAEPKYAAHKLKKGAGAQVGIWQGARRPLYRTFTVQSDPDHVESVSATGMEWGSKRGYAAAFSRGGRYQPWDRILAPAREVIRAYDKIAFRLAKGFQRVIRGRMSQSEFAAARAQGTLLVESP